MLSLLLAVPSCIYSFWHGVIPTSYFIFTLVSLICLSRLSLYCSAQRDAILLAYTYAHASCAGSCDVYVQSAIKWHPSKTEIAAVDLDLAFCKSDAYKFHITHENKVVSCKNRGF